MISPTGDLETRKWTNNFQVRLLIAVGSHLADGRVVQEGMDCPSDAFELSHTMAESCREFIFDNGF